jgi:RHS repeat-associated protein
MVGSSVTLANVSYEWDAENRLTAINNGINRSEFYYDGLGRRVEIIEKTNGVAATNNWYLWCGNAICEIRDATGATTLRRLYPQGETLVGANASTNYFYTKDHLESIREALDANGVLATRYDYDPYGQLTTLVENFKTILTFTGHVVHSPSGLYLTFHRQLDSVLGRWLSRDPIEENNGANLYLYVGNNPPNRVDHLGLQEFVPFDPNSFDVGSLTDTVANAAKDAVGDVVNDLARHGPELPHDDNPDEPNWTISHIINNNRCNSAIY